MIYRERISFGRYVDRFVGRYVRRGAVGYIARG